ncbi:hypothetical protein ACFWNK_01910 [Streptomyces sp. NPDC058417]|uniref:hypothetical protein n=1 Tax=unclassified Streptomyces TaxID=2593676 RepID=UPI0036633FB8
MTRTPRLLAPLYALAALALAHCTARSYQAGSIPYALLLGGCSLAALTAAAHTALLRSELRCALLRLERTARPIVTAQDRTVAEQLAEACCERWWTSAGEHHDPTTCTRKDHHA